MTTWFTSDPHFYHTNVIEYCNRPYRNSKGEPLVELMNEGLIANWNASIKPDDTVYCLGDFSFAIRPVELFSARLNGNKFLVPGNHDWCHPCNKKSKTEEKRANITKKYEEFGWTVLPINTEYNLEGAAHCNVSHMPYRGDDTDARHHRWRMEDDGRVLLCGHVHQHWKTKRTPKGTLMVNMGVDVWDLKPVSEDTLKALILSELNPVSSK